MEKMDRATEARILSSIEKTIRLTKEGMDSSKALLKVASEERFHPEVVKRMAEAMNVSRTRAHMQSAPAEKRAESFPLVDAGWVIDQMYPREIVPPIQEKAANWIPEEYSRRDTTNFFELREPVAVPSLVKSAEAKEAPVSSFREGKLMAKQAGLKKLESITKSDLRIANMELFKQAQAVAMHFRDVYTYNFPEIERRAFAKYGEAGRKVMDMLYGLGGLQRFKVKRASLEEREALVWDGKKAPYAWIDELFKKAEVLQGLAKKAVDREYELAVFNNEHGFRQAWQPERQPGILDDLFDSPVFTFDKGAEIGVGGGEIVNRGQVTPEEYKERIDRQNVLGLGAKTIPGQEGIQQAIDAENPEIARLRARGNAAKPNAVQGFGTKAAPATPAPATPAPAPAPATPAPAPAPAAQTAKKTAAVKKSNQELEAMLNGLADRGNAIQRDSVPGFGTGQEQPPPVQRPPVQRPPVQKNPVQRPPAQAPKPAPAPAPKAPVTKQAETNRPFAKSAVDPFSTGMVMGSMALGLREPPELSKYREVLADVYDPAHESRMNAIKSKAMLNDFLSNDPILSSYDPETVTNIYNQIASMAPNAAQQPALMRGLLRKSIQQGGVIEPFEVQQLTQMESAFKGETPPHYSPLYTEKGSVKK